MKISVSFMLLLLLGAVSASESFESKLAFPQDIYAALREMTASLVQLKADMTLSQRETQGQVDKLKTKVAKQKTEVDKLKQQIEPAAQLKTKVDKLKKQLQGQAAQQKVEVDKLKQQQLEQAAQQKTEVDKLNKQLQVRQVAFSASLLAGGQTANTGPFSSITTLIYKHVPTNIGNAYNSNTGEFTAPVRGAYNFEWTIFGQVDGSHASGAVLVKNSEAVFQAYEYQTAGWMSASNAATLLLEVGDRVSVRLRVDTRAYDDYNHYTTFSGFLLFPM
ncbi:hypothetical protein PFLUV_G00185500 [Perca fluviatilis]|uniref:C1q domain-containing protein n=1 Tax=Perca fluviatilis TaxID=8168 RepID=A0A6A5EQA2_PERFL|nr:complement C1q tumor necrosis factor-related protein 6-like [Perca fluviatilis]KAF1378044.1 hypothetical protein PFLUV_G00185500 [Perca fluviatilis]